MKFKKGSKVKYRDGDYMVGIVSSNQKDVIGDDGIINIAWVRIKWSDGFMLDENPKDIVSITEEEALLISMSL